MVLYAKTFILNLLCAIVPCEPNYGHPDVTSIQSNNTAVTEFAYNSFQDDPSGPKYRKPEFDPIVLTKSGYVQGYSMAISNGNSIFAFEGIYYAEAPKGSMRFRNPVPKKAWKGVFEAKKPSPICVQLHLRKLARIVGSEDCLSLNIYTPSLPTHYGHPNLPVLFQIHGGSYYYGAGSEYGPSYLLQEPVILVTINFRQGVYAYLSTHDDANPGNFGLKDQALALRWIHENIAFFGGDNSRITLLAQSSGACAAHLHLMSPLSRGLFSGIIMRSASAFNHWAVSLPHKSRRLTMKLARRLRCPMHRGTYRLMECIRRYRPSFLVYHARQLHDFVTFPPVLFAPVVEPDVPGAFLTDTPENLYKRGLVAKVPMIISVTTEEADATIVAVDSVGLTKFFQRNWKRWSRYILDFDYVARNTTELTYDIRRFYMGTRDPAKVSIHEISKVVSDRYFRVGIHKAIQYHSMIAPTYPLQFGYRTNIGFAANWGRDPEEWGVGHGEDGAYLFNSSLYFRPVKKYSEAEVISDFLVRVVSSFAHDRIPIAQMPDGTIVKWNSIKNPYDLNFLLVDNTGARTVPEPRPEAIEYWETLGLADTSPPFRANWLYEY